MHGVIKRLAPIQHRRSGAPAALAGLALAIAIVVPVSASTSISLSATERGSYSCLGPCAVATYFNATGLAHSDAFGTMTYVAQGVVLDYNPDTNCLDQSETWAFTAQNGHGGRDTLVISTTSDTFCFTDDPNISLESASFVVTGGTGRFAGATGSGTFSETVLTHPQIGSGVLRATLTL